MLSQLSQLAGLAAGLSILTSFLLFIVLVLGACALVLTIRSLRSRVEQDATTMVTAMRTRPDHAAAIAPDVVRSSGSCRSLGRDRGCRALVSLMSKR